MIYGQGLCGYFRDKIHPGGYLKVVSLGVGTIQAYVDGRVVDRHDIRLVQRDIFPRPQKGQIHPAQGIYLHNTVPLLTRIIGRWEDEEWNQGSPWKSGGCQSRLVHIEQDHGNGIHVQVV